MTIQQLDVSNATNIQVVTNIDLIWIKDIIIKAIFEVESTTTMTSALLRGSNLDKEIANIKIGGTD